MPASQNRTSVARTKKRRKKPNAQWAAQFAVASELCKLGYEVAFTLGHNTPLADLMVISPRKRHFLVDVKGLKAKNPWILKRKDERTGLYYILVLVPQGNSNRFFILTQAEANRLVRRYRAAHNPRWDGFSFAYAEPYENNWKETLPA